MSSKPKKRNIFYGNWYKKTKRNLESSLPRDDHMCWWLFHEGFDDWATLSNDSTT